METGLKKEDSMALKGMAILMMVFYHCYYKTTKFSKYDLVFRCISAEKVVIIASCLKICVALFAFVSGYGLMCGYRKEWNGKFSKKDFRWVLRHLISTLSGYWFVVLWSYVIYGIFIDRSFRRLGKGHFRKLVSMIMDLLGIAKLTETKSLNGSWWYISAAVIFILLVPLCYQVIKRCGTVISLGIIFAFPRITGTGFPGGAAPASFLMIFVIGMACAEHDFFSWFHNLGKQYKNSRIWKAVLLGGCLVIAFWLYPQLNIKKIWEYQYALVPFLVIIFSVEYLFKIPHVSSFFQYFGKHSLNIWLIHTFIRDYGGKVVFSVREFWLVPIVIILISLVFSYIIEWLKKVTGYQRLIGSIQQKLR